MLELRPGPHIWVIDLPDPWSPIVLRIDQPYNVAAAHILQLAAEALLDIANALEYYVDEHGVTMTMSFCHLRTPRPELHTIQCGRCHRRHRLTLVSQRLCLDTHCIETAILHEHWLYDQLAGR